MTPADERVPVVLFAYARPWHLRRTLDALRANDIPLLYVYCDGPKDSGDDDNVAAVREMVAAIDWCETRITCRDLNLGLGTSIRTGVSEVLARHEMVVVFEDDIVCVPGTYAYLVAALRRYRHDPRVMSVSAWTHPAVRPPVPPDQAYFDGRFSCWGWGSWRRAWVGMDKSARRLMWECRLRLMDVYRYGGDLAGMAREETLKNVWAVRFAFLHQRRGGLCFHPPWSLSAHVGFDATAMNAREANTWAMALPDKTPPQPDPWPEPEEHPAVPGLWQSVCGRPEPFLTRVVMRMKEAWWRLGRRWSVLSDPEGMHKVALRRCVIEALAQWREGHFGTAVDYGCGDRPYADSLARVAREPVGVDIGDNPLADRRVKAGRPLPFAAGSVDLVSSFQVLEHVEDYRVYLADAARVCRPGGTLLLSAPSVWPAHPHPTDFRRWTLDGLKVDLERAGFRVVKSWPVLNPVSTSCQYLLSVLLYLTRARGRWARGLVRCLAVCLNAGILASERLTKSSLRCGAGNYLVQAERTKA